MGAILDPDTVERLRSLPPRKAYEEAMNVVFRAGGSSSDDFLDVYEQLVDRGVLNWDQIEEFEQS